eukprot:TRINITY_DN8394_c0_g3_i1.p1 TRINITY_DN8394_c0_g3~~TRINITY_DN8394_c0_g3_i1.p1  ORF type:complete len:617 (-),score=74.65 TRINITY_DN8394_c0_g3_i1:193-2043(-)
MEVNRSVVRPSRAPHLITKQQSSVPPWRQAAAPSTSSQTHSRATRTRPWETREAPQRSTREAPQKGVVGDVVSIMLKNIPNRVTREKLHEVLDVTHHGEYDFLYVPMDFKTKCNRGFAFINFRSSRACTQFTEMVDGVEATKYFKQTTSKVLEVSPAHVQGFRENVEQIGQSKVIRDSADTPEWLPLIIDEQGTATDFPIHDYLGQPSAKKRKTAAKASAKKASARKEPAVSKKASSLTALDKMIDEDSPSALDNMLEEDIDHIAQPVDMLDDDIERITKPGDTTKPITTVVFNGLRKTCTREELVEFLNIQGFDALYDFVHLPLDFSDGRCLGHAIVNFVDTEVANEFITINHGNEGDVFDSTCNATLSYKHNGAEELIERYRNSPVMHHSVSRSFAPLIFENGERVPFPEPTQAIKAPKVRKREKKEGSVEEHVGRAEGQSHPEPNGSKPKSNNEAHDAKARSSSADTKCQGKGQEGLHKVLNSELEQQAKASRGLWTLVWVSEQVFKPDAEDQRRTLEALGCQVKGYKASKNAERALQKKNALTSTIVLVSAHQAEQLTTYLRSRPEMRRTPIVVEGTSKAAGVREDATCRVVGDFDAAVLAVSQIAAVPGFA